MLEQQLGAKKLPSLASVDDQQWAEHRRQRDEEDRRQRVTLITEFDAGDPPKEHAEFVAGTFIGAYTPTHSR